MWSTLFENLLNVPSCDEIPDLKRLIEPLVNHLSHCSEFSSDFRTLSNLVLKY